ncbi:MAG TPA: hypothetical protein VGC35_05420 [Allosphingosinicella sp.]|jgi:hypothetical protein
MRLVLAAASIALLAASPAFATGGFTCKPVSGAGPVLTLTVGHTAVASVISARLSDSAAKLAVGQSWIDWRTLWLDLVDSNSVRVEARLRATFQPKLRGRPAIGTLVRGGRTYRVRCEES